MSRVVRLPSGSCQSWTIYKRLTSRLWHFGQRIYLCCQTRRTRSIMFCGHLTLKRAARFSSDGVSFPFPFRLPLPLPCGVLGSAAWFREELGSELDGPVVSEVVTGKVGKEDGSAAWVAKANSPVFTLGIETSERFLLAGGCSGFDPSTTTRLGDARAGNVNFNHCGIK